LKNQWQGRLRLQAEVYTHSSIPESQVTPAAKDFAQKIAATDGRQYVTLKVTIIWKDVSTTEMISSPSKLIPVYGEINIIRFLNRIGPNEFHYEIDNHAANLHDQVLDICYQLSKKHTNKERQQFVKQLGQRLGNSQFYNNEPALSISDIAVSSILKKLFAESLKELPANLSSWLQQISTVARY
jgi:aminoacyl tRNA synthase complex-interacting multifunctional protein 2